MPANIVVTVEATEFIVVVPGVSGDDRFWSMFAAGEFEPATIDVLRRELGPRRRFLDVGAWIGPCTLLAAALGADVVAIEADPAAAAALTANLTANPSLASRVEMQPVALAAHGGRVRLDTGRGGPGGGLGRVIADPLGAIDAIDAGALDLDGFDVIKIDIEGAEYDVVPRLGPALRRQHPVLLLSLHGPDSTGCTGVSVLRLRVANAVRQARLLWALRTYRHISRVRTHRSSEVTALRLWQRVMLIGRLGEIELICRR